MNQDNVNVSVIITTHNRIDWLKEALVSVKNQSFINYEIILVNDHEESNEEIKLLAKAYSDLTLINNFETPGANYSRNIGIELAKGKYIAFLDDDDTWEVEYLNEQVLNLESHNIDLSYSGYYEFWDRKEPIKLAIHSRQPPENLKLSMEKGLFCPDTTSTVVVSSKAIKSCNGFDTTLTSFQDWDMWYRLSGKINFGNVTNPLVSFRQHLGARTSVDATKRLTGLKQIMSKYKDILDDSFYQKFELGCHYSNAKKYAMFKKRKYCTQSILSSRLFFTTFMGWRLMAEILYKCFLKKWQ